MEGKGPIASGAGALPKPPQRPERNLTIISVSTGIIFAFIGSTVGALYLGQISGVPVGDTTGLFPSHPYLQIYGFIALFVMGVDYSLLPRFKVGRLPGVFFGYAAYASVTAANVLFLLYSVFPPGSFPFTAAGATLMLLGSAIFLSQVATLVARPMGGFPEANPLIVLSSISLVLISSLLVVGAAGYSVVGDAFSPQMILLALVGFAGSMIYAVEIRSVSFRQCNYRKQAANLCWVLQGLGIAALFVGVLAGSVAVSEAGALLLMGAAASELVAIKILELAHPLMYRPAMTKMHFRIMHYNEVCMLMASGWLLFGTLLGVAWLATQTDIFFVKDAFIHSIALGFVGSTITCFAPMLIPGLLGRKGPATGLTYGPVTLLNAGVFLRIIGDALSVGTGVPPVWESLSGPFILGAMIWFLLMLRGIGRPAQASPRPSPPARFDIADSKGVAEGKLTVTTRKTNRQVTFPVWFVVQGKTVHLLPVHGSATDWYRNLKKNGSVTISIAGNVYGGAARAAQGKEAVKPVMDLFRDKYGDRNCTNFFGDRADVVVSIPTG